MAKPIKPMAPERAARQVVRYADLLRLMYKDVSAKRSINLQSDLLLVHILKALSSADAILLLGQHYHVEEITILTRTLSEIVVNSCYLLIADELEVSRFMKFDYVKGVNRTEKLRRHIPDPVEHPQQLVEAITQMSKVARGEIRRTEKDSSWSQYSLEQRAEIVDKCWIRATFKTLVLAEGILGHSAVHATLSSLTWFIQLTAGSVSTPNEDRSMKLGLALHGTAFCCLHSAPRSMNDFHSGSAPNWPKQSTHHKLLVLSAKAPRVSRGNQSWRQNSLDDDSGANSSVPRRWRVGRVPGPGIGADRACSRGRVGLGAAGGCPARAVGPCA